ncbi:unnamed protein product, partial [Effrenium voratum]
MHEAGSDQCQELVKTAKKGRGKSGKAGDGATGLTGDGLRGWFPRGASFESERLIVDLPSRGFVHACRHRKGLARRVVAAEMSVRAAQRRKNQQCGALPEMRNFLRKEAKEIGQKARSQRLPERETKALSKRPEGAAKKASPGAGSETAEASTWPAPEAVKKASSSGASRAPAAKASGKSGKSDDAGKANNGRIGDTRKAPWEKGGGVIQDESGRPGRESSGSAWRNGTTAAGGTGTSRMPR